MDGAGASHNLFLGGYCARRIENGLHGVRDGTLGEDASQIKKGSAPEVMAFLRNMTIFLLKRLGHKNAAAATRHDVCHPEKSL